MPPTLSSTDLVCVMVIEMAYMTRRAYVQQVQGKSKLWLSEQLARELQRLQLESQQQGETVPAESSSQILALKHLRRQITAYQVSPRSATLTAVLPGLSMQHRTGCQEIERLQGHLQLLSTAFTI